MTGGAKLSHLPPRVVSEPKGFLCVVQPLQSYKCLKAAKAHLLSGETTFYDAHKLDYITEKYTHANTQRFA